MDLIEILKDKYDEFMETEFDFCKNDEIILGD